IGNSIIQLPSVGDESNASTRSLTILVTVEENLIVEEYHADSISLGEHEGQHVELDHTLDHEGEEDLYINHESQRAEDPDCEIRNGS
ncbi:hypothetical protein PMAYCL1PPCAC_27028, partial [Pristionchus mayeri]